MDVYRMNVYNGKFFRQITSPGPVINWATDRDGVLRLAALQDEESLSYETKIIYRDGEDEELEKSIVLKGYKMVGEPLVGMKTKRKSTLHPTLEETPMQ
ncbi:MAG: hypothetical protein Ct9H90mP13_09620 [Pseudomonadota bacterium]|nr:MAG: hypothetical protein Ct9H90mP13_09620 [Pseudomonadota bacterium]